MDPVFEYNLLQTRRQFFGHTGLRLGGLALGMLAGKQALKTLSNRPRPASIPPLPGLPHFAAEGQVAHLYCT